jgi:hypothetical protein
MASLARTDSEVYLRHRFLENSGRLDLGHLRKKYEEDDCGEFLLIILVVFMKISVRIVFRV